ncbi:MAG: S24 family peptidase [Bacteroidaceae bacterium]|nr:S24 family peptidase [Bacteroidaceae bacterium]
MGKSIKERVVEIFKYKNLNVNKASAVLGIPQRTLNRQVNEAGKITMDLVYAILDSFPEVSPLWILTGEGSLLRDEEQQSKDGSSPYYRDMPVSAGLRDAVDVAKEKPQGRILLPKNKADFYFPVTGTSMEPEVFEGDIVGVTRVNSYEKISSSNIYMIVTNETRMIKHCYPDDNNKDILWCVSPNYPSFPVKKSDICALYRVVARIQFL